MPRGRRPERSEEVERIDRIPVFRPVRRVTIVTRGDVGEVLRGVPGARAYGQVEDEVARMFDGEATRRALDQQLNESGFQPERYRSLLLAIIQAEQQKYDVPAARKRTLALVRSTYGEMG